MKRSLNGAGLSILIKLVIKVFNPDTLDAALRIGMEVRLAVLATGNNFEIVVFRLCEKLSDEGKLDVFAAALKKANPNPDLHSELDDLLGVTGAAPGGSTRIPYKSLLLQNTPPVPFVNRGKLRAHLEEICTTPDGFRALSVNGSPATGKTWGRQMIEQTAGYCRATPVVIDLTVATGWDLTFVCKHITNALGLDVADMLDWLQSDDRAVDGVASKFVVWLATAQQSLPNRVWLIIDGLSDASAPAGAREHLATGLLKAAIQGQLGNIFLVVLGDTIARVKNAGLYGLHEDASGLNVGDLRDFLVSYARQLGYALPDADLEQAITRILGPHTWPFDHPAMEHITVQLATECRGISKLALAAAAAPPGGTVVGGVVAGGGTAL